MMILPRHQQEGEGHYHHSRQLPDLLPHRNPPALRQIGESERQKEDDPHHPDDIPHHHPPPRSFVQCDLTLVKYLSYDYRLRQQGQSHTIYIGI